MGTSGIVVQETENTFKVVTRKDRLKGAVSAYRRSFRGSVALVNAGADPSNLLQFCQSRVLSLRSPSLFIVQDQLLVVARWQTREQAVVAAAAMTRDTGKQYSMAHTSSSSCTGTSSAFARRIERDESSSTRRPSSCEAI